MVRKKGQNKPQYIKMLLWNNGLDLEFSPSLEGGEVGMVGCFLPLTHTHIPSKGWAKLTLSVSEFVYTLGLVPHSTKQQENNLFSVLQS